MKSLIVGSFAACLVLPGVVCPASADPNPQPDFRGVRAALARPATPLRLAVTPASVRTIRAAGSHAAANSVGHDAVWDGALIGLGIGTAGGLIWARHVCGRNNPECMAIAGTVGVLGGAAIGGTIGAIADRLHK